MDDLVQIGIIIIIILVANLILTARNTWGIAKIKKNLADVFGETQELIEKKPDIPQNPGRRSFLSAVPKKEKSKAKILHFNPRNNNKGTEGEDA